MKHMLVGFICRYLIQVLLCFQEAIEANQYIQILDLFLASSVYSVLILFNIYLMSGLEKLVISIAMR